MNVADFIIDRLAKEGVKEIFEVYGAANGDLIDAFTRVLDTRYISVMHEQAGGFAAEGYAKIRNNLAAAIATSGPGGQNFVTPIANCHYDSVPVIFLTGQVQSRFMRQDDSIRQSGFQETPIVEIVKPITKYAQLVKDPEKIKYELEKAIFLAKEGRPGPVLLDLPIDVQKANVDLEKLVSFEVPSNKFYTLEPIDKLIEGYLSSLNNSERPVLLIGGGVRIADAIPELMEVLEKLRVPCFPTWNALDVITSDNPFYGGRVGSYGGPGRNFAIQNSDLLLAIGSRISGRITGGNPKSFARAAKKYLVDIDESSLEKKFQPVPFDECLPCDAKLFLSRMNQMLDGRKIKDFRRWGEKVIFWRNKYSPVSSEYSDDSSYVNPYVFMKALSNGMNEGDILVGDCGGNIVVTSQAFETKKGQRLITNNGNSPMGFSFCGAMGAYLASDKSHNVVCLIGDGGFNMNLQELQTIKNYNIKVKTFLMNNHCYGITRQFQRTNFEGRMEACGPKGYSPPDFLRICKAYDIKTFSIENPSHMEKVIQETLNCDEPAVCNIDMGDWDNYGPRVFGGAPIEDMQPYLDREEFISNMIIPPMPGWENFYKK